MKTAVEKAKEWGIESTGDFITPDTVRNVIAALDEYSMEMSVAFADWIIKNAFISTLSPEGRTWFNFGLTKIYTTNELYGVFLSRVLKKEESEKDKKSLKDCFGLENFAMLIPEKAFEIPEKIEDPKWRTHL